MFHGKTSAPIRRTGADRDRCTLRSLQFSRFVVKENFFFGCRKVSRKASGDGGVSDRQPGKIPMGECDKRGHGGTRCGEKANHDTGHAQRVTRHLACKPDVDSVPVLVRSPSRPVVRARRTYGRTYGTVDSPEPYACSQRATCDGKQRSRTVLNGQQATLAT